MIDHAHTGLSLVLDPGRHAPSILRHLDGARSFGEIFRRVRDDRHVDAKELPDEALFADFRSDLRNVQRIGQDPAASPGGGTIFVALIRLH